MHAIAAQADVAHGTVLWHFGGKARLYEAVVQEAGGRLLCAMRAQHACRGTSFMCVARVWIDYLSRHRDVSSILRSLSRDSRHANVDRAAQWFYDRFVEFWSDWLRQSRVRDQVDARVATLAPLIAATLSGLLATSHDGTVSSVIEPLTEFAAAIDRLAEYDV